MSWHLASLESLCRSVYSGGTPSTNVDAYYGGDIPWLRTQEVTFGRITDTEIKITEAGLKNSAAKWVPPKSIVVAMYGNSAGRSAIAEIPLTTNQACCNLLVDDSKADYKFVFYSLLLNYEKLKGLSRGAAQNNLNAAQVKAFEIPTPPLYVQQSIGNVLSSYDDLIDNNRRRMALLEDSARQLYREWFVRLRFPGHEHTPIVDGVPQGWKKVRVDELGTVLTGKTPSTKDVDNYGSDIQFVKTPDMHGNAFVLQTETQLTEKGAKSQANKFLPPGALLVSCIGTVGVVSLTSELCQFNQQINAVIPMEDFLRYYSYFALKDLKPRLDAIGGGVTMANVSKSKFESMDVLRPTSALLRNFDEFSGPVFNQIKVLGQQNQKLRQARDLLLPRLMNGELAV